MHAPGLAQREQQRGDEETEAQKASAERLFHQIAEQQGDDDGGHGGNDEIADQF